MELKQITLSLIKNLKFISKLVVPIIGLAIYIKENKNPQRHYKDKNKHDLYNVGNSLIVNSVNKLLKKQTENIFHIFDESNFGLINYFKISELNKNILSIFIIDFYMYNWHKINHESSFLWYFHKFHHKDNMLDSSSGIRFHLGELLLSEIFRTLILIPLGIKNRQIKNYEKILLPIIIFHHSNINIDNKLDDLLKLIITSPSFHRIHHSKIIYEANSNYGSVFSFWDKIFQSYTKNNAQNYIDFGIIEHG